MVRIHSLKATCFLPPARPCPQQAGPTVGTSDVKPVASSSLPTLTAKFTASPSGANRYYVCPETEKQRSKTAPGDPNREYLKYQRNGKWGPGICLIYLLYGRSRKSFLSLLGRRFWGSREGQGGPGRKQDREGGKEQWVGQGPLSKPKSLRSLGTNPWACTGRLVKMQIPIRPVWAGAQAVAFPASSPVLMLQV